MPKLVCVHGLNKEDEFAVREGTMTIGRAADCDIVLYDKKASRHHCQVFRKSTYFTIEDLGSRHGTIVNGKKVARRKSLKYDDKIFIGKTVLVLSEKVVGGILEQTAAAVASELEQQGDAKQAFNALIDNASVDAAVSQKEHASQRAGGKGFWKTLSGLFSSKGK